MSDDYKYQNNYHSKIVEIDDTNYLIQGYVKDPITMFRPIDELLECEKDNIQKILRGKQE